MRPDRSTLDPLARATAAGLLNPTGEPDAAYWAAWERWNIGCQAMLRQHGFIDAAGLVGQMAGPEREPTGLEYRGG